MPSLARMTLAAAALLAVTGPGLAQSGATIHDPPGPKPDPGHIPFTLPAGVKWKGDPAVQQTATLFGDPGKPGLYGVLIKWMPGHFSHPHFHTQDRFIYVVSGTWWVSSSTHYDPAKTYPLPAGSVSEDVANTVHWDGARLGGPPAILELVGMGPVKTVAVDENGKPKPGHE